MLPSFHAPAVAVAQTPTSHGIDWRVHGRGSGGTHQFGQIAIEVGGADRHNVNSRHTNAFEKKSVALLHKGTAIFRAIFVAGAHELDDSYQTTLMGDVVDQDLVFGGSGYVGIKQQRGTRRRPSRRRDAAVVRKSRGVRFR